MNLAYWESVAANYEGEVLSVFDHDTDGLVGARIAAAGAAVTGGRAADLGCGVGKFTPLLADSFAHVEACDCSVRGLRETRARCRDRANVSFHALDLVCDPMPFEPVDFVLCVNVLIMPMLDERMRAWRTVTNQVAQGGTILLVVPSLESVQYEQFLALADCLQTGATCAEAIRQTQPVDDQLADLFQGVHQLDGLRTKHYLREEVSQMLSSHEFDVQELMKLEYRTHGEAGAACGWDWMVVARRR